MSACAGSTPEAGLDPVSLEVFKNRFAAIAEEMGVTLLRTAFSANIKERRDFSCAVFDSAGDLVAQAAHIPVHLGSMPLSVRAAIRAVPLGPGDMAVLNNPFDGGTHLPDITLVAPVFSGADAPAFYVANRAHHADIGGMAAGSMPLSSTLFQEGLVIPPLKLVEQGRIDQRLLCFILSNVRTPVEREGDFSAQIMANVTGIRRMEELTGRFGLATAQCYARGLMDYSGRIMRKVLADIPDGLYRFEDVIEDDGLGNGPLPIRLSLRIAGDAACLDFTDCAPQTRGCVNAVRAIVLSAVLYVFRTLMPDHAPVNAGCLAPLEVLTRPGTLLDAQFPAAVAGGNVETSQRIVDVILGALAQALPARIPAASQGTMNNVALGGVDPVTGRPFAYYETLAGGMGAGPRQPGASAMHSHMTNTLNTPVEALEYDCPLRVERYALRPGSGGRGRQRGGDGLVRELRLLADAEVTVLSERRRTPPWGLAGGEPGAVGRNVVIRDNVPQERPGKFHELLRQGDVLRIETPGGGGWGKAE